MTAEPTPNARETDEGPSYVSTAASSEATRGVDLPGPTAAVLWTGVVGLVALDRVVAVLANVPFDPVVTSPAVRSVTGTLALLAVVSALLAVAVVDGRTTVRVGLVFAAVFGPLPLVAPSTALLAVVAVTVGGAMALVGALGAPPAWTHREIRRRLLAVGFVAALAVTLVGVTGLVGGIRDVGAVLTLATMAAVGTLSEGSRLAAGAGLAAVGGVVVASVVSPFVVGSALLVAFAVTGVPSLLVALALAGTVAGAVAGLSRRAYALAVGGAVLVLAGVPATFPRALTLLLGATLVVLSHADEETGGVAR